MNLILFDDSKRDQLLPFTFMRPCCDIRIGTLTIREKWEKRLKKKSSTYTQDYLSAKFPLETREENLFVNGRVCPNEKLIIEIELLKQGQKLTLDGTVIAAKGNPEQLEQLIKNEDVFLDIPSSVKDFSLINNVWHIFQKNGIEIQNDFSLLTENKTSVKLSATNRVIGNPDLIFLEEGTKAECAIFNTSDGPIYLDKHSEVMEGSVIRGPFSLGEHSQAKMATKIYGPTTFGPHCKVGGEVNNSVLFGYSNKAHDGFLGNSVISEWCNLGADTNNSNLKNNYAPVKLHNFISGLTENTGLQFCGLMMGDHSKAGINTMFNTGTVTGVFANIFGGDFPPTYIPSFSWGGAKGFEKYILDKAVETAQSVMARRGIELSATDKEIITYLSEQE